MLRRHPGAGPHDDRLRFVRHQAGRLRALRRAGYPARAEPDSEVVARAGAGARSPRATTACSTAAAGREDLEALVLLHQDTEIVDADFCRKVCAGARRTRAWASWAAWGRSACAASPGGRARSRWRRSSNRYEEHGGGDLPGLLVGLGRGAALRAGRRGGDARRLPARAVALDGAQRALRRGRCREFHGYDLDFCLQVREAGRKVVTADFRAIHHRPLEMLPDLERLGGGAHPGGREVGRPHARASGAAPGTLGGARAACRGRGARPRGRSPTALRTGSSVPGSSALARCARASLAADRAAALVQRLLAPCTARRCRAARAGRRDRLRRPP